MIKTITITFTKYALAKGLEAYNSSDNQNYGTLDGGPQIKSGPTGNQVTA